MMARIITAALFATILIISFNACSDNSSSSTGDCNGLAWTKIAEDEITALSNAAIAYNQDPNAQTCQTYEGALRDYIEVLEEDINISCIPKASEEDYQEAISDAKQDIDTIDCSGS